MGNLEKTDYDDWEDITEQVREVDQNVSELVEVLNSVPKSVWSDQVAKADDAMTQLKHLLEERVAEEHPEKWDTDLFYGNK